MKAMLIFYIYFYIVVEQAMVTHGRVELLAHPLSQKYLQMKWNAYGKYFHVTNLLIYTVFLAFVTIYASQLMQNVDKISTIPQQIPSLNLSVEVFFLNFIFHLYLLKCSREITSLTA